MQKFIEESMRSCLTCPHTSPSSTTVCILGRNVQDRILQVQDDRSEACHDLHRKTKFAKGPRARFRACVTSTARPSDKRSPELLCRFLCSVLCEFFFYSGAWTIHARVVQNGKQQVRTGLRKRCTSVHAGPAPGDAELKKGLLKSALAGL